MKYRIKEVYKDGTSIYYPQLKHAWWPWWQYMMAAGSYDSKLFTHSLIEAQEMVQRFKRNMEKKKKNVTYHYDRSGESNCK